VFRDYAVAKQRRGLGGLNTVNRVVTKDFLSGLMFVAFGLGALYVGQHLAVGTPVRMGPGYVPRMLSFIMLALGVLICIVAVVSGSEPVERPKWKPITLVTIGIVCFALLFERAGLIPDAGRSRHDRVAGRSRNSSSRK